MVTQSKKADDKTAPDATTRTSEAIKEIRKMNGYDALRLMSTTKVASNLFLDPFYYSREMYEPMWTEPIIFTLPDKAFGSIVKAGSITFNVPGEFQGLTNTALILPSGSFAVDGKDDDMSISIRSRSNSKIILVPNFPATIGWYNTDPNTGIPQNIRSSKVNSDARFLWRNKNKPYVGPTARSEFLGDMRSISADAALDKIFGVALLEPDIKKLQRRAL